MGENRPIVGVIACGREVEGEPAQAVKHRYLEAVARYAQAIPLIVPTNQPLENAGDIVARLDAILLTGSNSNIVPQRYGSSAEARLPRDDARDAFSAALIHAAIAATKPVFGICRGLQEINVALGGSLRDMRERETGELHHAAVGAALGDTFGHRHDLHIRAESQLARITGSSEMSVNSVHYQTIDRLADGLSADATSPDGIIEAISAESSAAPIFAVQWHPEWRTAERPADQKFFVFLGEAARAAAEARS